MRKSIRLLAAAVGIAVFAPVAHAQDMTTTTATVGGTTVWVGGGVQFLSLPDIRFVAKGSSPTNMHRQKNSESDWLDFGGSAGGGIETSLGMWGAGRVTGSIKGFWSNVETDDRSSCNSQTCFVFDPAGITFASGPPTLVTHTSRDADYWGGQAELKFGTGAPTEIKPTLYRNDYFIAGFDVRGIDQDNRLRGVFQGQGQQIYNYKESLDTTYVGGYIGFGGEYSFGFIPGVKNVGGLYDRLGLRTFVNFKAGLYDASTDYDGNFGLTSFALDGAGPFSSRISKSNDQLAFIGTISLETRKQIGLRTSLSLWTDYEYISSVPQMRYADTNHPTRFSDDDVFASRTMLRLNIGLGSQQLYEEPLK
jgi:hypothetical protein